MNLIGLTEDIPFGPAEPSDEDIKHIIDLTHEMGGLVSVNHIPWSNKTGMRGKAGDKLEFWEDV